MEISKEFKKWLDSYGENLSELKSLPKREYISVDELFNGRLLSEVIVISKQLLEKYGDVVYEEHWTGYEDMFPSLFWHEQETGEEYELRISDLHEQFLEKRAEDEERKQREKLKLEIKAMQDKLNEL